MIEIGIEIEGAIAIGKENGSGAGTIAETAAEIVTEKGKGRGDGMTPRGIEIENATAAGTMRIVMVAEETTMTETSRRKITKLRLSRLLLETYR